MTRLFLQKRLAESIGIFSGESGEFVDETFDCKSGVRMANRAQPLHGHANLRLMRFHRDIGNRVRPVSYTHLDVYKRQRLV